MDLLKAKAFLIKIMVGYWLLMVVIYCVSFRQFKYSEATSVSPLQSRIINEIVDGEVVRQKVTVPEGRLESISLMTATYDRVNLGTMNICLENQVGEVITRGTFSVAEAKNNAYTRIDLTEPLEGYGSQDLTLVLYTEGCGPDNAITIYAGDRFETGTSVDDTQYVQIGNRVDPVMLCVSLKTVFERRFYKTFWAITGGFFLIVLLTGIYWWRQWMRGRNNPLVAVCALATRYSLLFRQLVSRDFKSKYKRSVLGIFWSFLNPLLTMIVQYIVFSTLFKNSIENFPVYLLTGIVFFNFFNEAVNMGMTSITGNASLIKKVYMPKYIYLLSRIASSMINFMLALIPLFLVILITKTKLCLSMLLLVFDILCLLGFVTGMGLLLTTSMTFFQDTQFLWNVISMIWMYLTPLFYPETIIPDSWIHLYRLNPLYQFITFARTCIIQGVSPQPEMYLGCVASACIVLLLGITVFKRFQDRFILYL